MSKAETTTSVNVLGVNIHTISLQFLLDFIIHRAREEENALVLYVNIHAMNIAYENTWFQNLLNHANIVFCDGVGVQLGARILGKHIPSHFTPSDWIFALSQLCFRENLSMYFLGAHQGVANEAANNLIKHIPDLRIVGTHHGYFNNEASNKENLAVIEAINNSEPDILFIGFGMPLQEKWAMGNMDNQNTHVIITVGAMFDYLAHEVPRAPEWMTNNGLEWLGRLIIEPGRLWKRYLIGNFIFFWRIINTRIKENVAKLKRRDPNQ